ncbi:MAG TPA: hypothetical protein VH880_06535 [Anaeromyxobacteraceae bacterium]|jgi:hypothetical protein
MTLRTILPILSAVAVAAGCSQGKGTLSVNAKSNAAATQGAALDAGNGLTIERVRIAVCEVELEKSHPDDGSPGPGGPSLVARRPASSSDSPPGDDGPGDDMDDDGHEVEVGPFLIDLGIDVLGDPTKVPTVAVGDVPEGVYDETEVEICVPVVPEGSPLADLAAAGASIVVDGIRPRPEGAEGFRPFTFATAIAFELEHEAPFEVGPDGTASVTVAFDASGWFKKADGTLLDPELEADRAAIEANIRASFQAFEDDDHDGEDDSEEDDGGTDSDLP